LQTVNSPVAILLGATVVSVLGLFFLPPIPQDQAYHQLADQRAIFGIPNFWNVVSNLPFLLIGAAGLRLSGSPSARVIFLGIFGSASAPLAITGIRATHR
jgi:hypothetical protein